MMTSCALYTGVISSLLPDNGEVALLCGLSEVDWSSEFKSDRKKKSKNSTEQLTGKVGLKI